jgi:hypothetical protein
MLAIIPMPVYATFTVMEENQMEDFVQIVKVLSDETDGDEFGHEWKVYYILYQTEDQEGYPCYDLYTDDGLGNGVRISRGYKLRDMQNLILKLGKFIEWKKAA